MKKIIFLLFLVGSATYLFTHSELQNSGNIYLEKTEETIINLGKNSYKEIIPQFQGVLTADNKVLREGNGYYGYNFESYKYFESDYGVSDKELTLSGINPERDLIYQDGDNAINFVSEYSKTLLTNSSLINTITNKNNFLQELADDAKHPSLDIPQKLEQIKILTQELIINTNSDQEKIARIYNWILENIRYTENINLDNTQIFSGIEAFSNGDGVCTAYTKLMLYMLSFAGISDVEVIRGQVIDAPDFPEIGHAWLRIGDRYYDPTFDDPVGARNTKTVDEYMYYGLPKDIFYANRFEYGDLPEYLETASMHEREVYIFNTLSNLLPKYGVGTENYPLFQPIIFYNQYDIPTGVEITPEYLATKIGSYTVSEQDYSFTLNGQIQRIRSYQYYPLTTENIPSVLNSLNYNLSGSYLFKWTNLNGTEDWRLAYDVELR